MDELTAAGRPEPPTSHRRVLNSIVLVATATLAAKLIGLARDLLVARNLGTGDELDAYFVAMILPSYAVVVLAHTFASGFVPTYVRTWQTAGLAAAQRLAGATLSAATGVLAVVTLAILVIIPLALPLVGIGFSPPKIRLAWQLSYLVAGMVLASGVSAVLASLLNAHERFTPVAIAPAMIPLGTLAVFAGWAGTAGVYALAAGTLVGFLAETVALAAAAVWLGLFPLPRLPWKNPLLKAIGRQYLPVMFAGLLMSSSLVVDQSMAASLGSGDVSTFNFGGKVVAVVLSVVAVSMSTVLFPRFAHLISVGRTRELMRTFALYSGGIVLLSLPAIVLLAIASQPLVRLLFERGAFTADATEAVVRVQICLLPQIPFYIVAMLGARVLSALDANSAVLRIAALNLVCNVVGNLLLMRAFGVAGIAISTSLMYAIATGATLIAIRVRVRDRQGSVDELDA